MASVQSSAARWAFADLVHLADVVLGASVSPCLRRTEVFRLRWTTRCYGYVRELWKEARDDGDPWLAEAADSGRVFMTGDSASGNIAHHLAVRFSSAAEHADLAPDSVHDCPTDALLRRCGAHAVGGGRLSLPEGATADHPVANPFGTGALTLDAVDFALTLVVVGSRSKDKGGPP
ncbi:carboxylesterase 15-like [Phragmites australis]|uniref:carboxylesterase 15-like n=1 Tax=Phragmites australis TaxID=29695 RepID=UPI002D765667|nr:carboxylesterase 15-like [Phragmites australis]